MSTKQLQQNSSLKKKVYAFQVSGVGFVAAHSPGNEVILQPKFSPLPNAPDYVLGFCNLKGLALPSYNLLPLMNQHAGYEQNFAYGLHLGLPGRSIVIALKNKPQVLAADSFKATQKDLFAGPLEAFVKKRIEYDGQAWGFLDFSNLAVSLASAEALKLVN